MNAVLKQQQDTATEQIVRADYWATYQKLQELWRRGDRATLERFGRSTPDNIRDMQAAVREMNSLKAKVNATLVELEA